MVSPKKSRLLFLPIFIAPLLLYFPSLKYYFFQDDWFVLNWVSFQNFASFFSFRTDIIYWRPLSMPLLFAFAKSIFGLNPLGYHILAFLIFFALIITIFNLFLTLTKDKKMAYTGAFLYAVWPIHYISLSWFSTTSYIIGPLFQCLSFIFFIKFQDAKKGIFKLASYLFFLLGVMSSEFTLVLPFIFLVWGIFAKKKNYLSFVLPLLAIDAIYFAMRIFVFKIPATGTYSTTLNIQVLYNFFWYILWSFGLPESFKSLIDPRIVNQSIKVITQFWQITIPFTLLSAFSISGIIKSLKKNLNLFTFGFLWFLIGLLPVIFVTGHSYPVYLSFAGIGLIFALLTAFKKSKTSTLILFVLLWTVLSCTNLQFTRLTHWIKNEQAVSAAYVNIAKQKAPNPPPDSAFLFRPANQKFSAANNFVLVEVEDTLKLSLNDQSAMQVIANDKSIKSFYQKNNENLVLPKDIPIFTIAPSL